MVASLYTSNMEISLKYLQFSSDTKERWKQACELSIICARQSSITIEGEKLQERCILNQDGSLLLYIDIPNLHKIEMLIPRDEWSYRNKQIFA